MELRVLRYFLAVAEHGSITAGAEKVRISQPAVSRQLAALERELGTRLFQRGHGALTLTHAGREFQVIARDLLQRADRAGALVGRGNDEELRLTVVAQSTTIRRSVAPFVAAQGGVLPIIDALDARPSEVFEVTAARGADIGISTVPPPANWAGRKLADIGLFAHVAPGHELFGRDSVEVIDLIRHRLIVMDESHMARLVLDDAIAKCGVEVSDPIEMRSAELAKAMAANGRGAAVLTDAAAYGCHEVRVMLIGRQVRMPVYAGWDGTHYARAAIERWVGAYEKWLYSIPAVAEIDAP